MAQVIINGNAYGLRFDLGAMERVEEAFGDLDAAFEALKAQNKRDMIAAVKTMFVITANCQRDFDGKPEDITAEVLKHAPLSALRQIGDAVTEAVKDSMRVETANGGAADDEIHDGYLEEIEAKNANPGD